MISFSLWRGRRVPTVTHSPWGMEKYQFRLHSLEPGTWNLWSSGQVQDMLTPTPAQPQPHTLLQAYLNPSRATLHVYFSEGVGHLTWSSPFGPPSFKRKLGKRQPSVHKPGHDPTLHPNGGNFPISQKCRNSAPHVEQEEWRPNPGDWRQRCNYFLPADSIRDSHEPGKTVLQESHVDSMSVHPFAQIWRMICDYWQERYCHQSSVKYYDNQTEYLAN